MSFVQRIRTIVSVGTVSLVALLSSQDLARPAEVGKPAVPPPTTKPPVRIVQQPLRVLLMGNGTTRDFQFCLTLFKQLQARGWTQTTLYAPQGDDRRPHPGLAAEQQLTRFPRKYDVAGLAEATPAERADNLTNYDLLIAFDPDWSELTAEQQAQLARWVRQGNGLIVVAGPRQPGQLGPPASQEKFGPITALYPVRPAEQPVPKPFAQDRPSQLSFAQDGLAEGDFLRLDENSDRPLGGWREFFTGLADDEPLTAEARLERGFYACFPTAVVQPNAHVLAGIGGPSQPFLATIAQDKGRVVYLASGETWRLRAARGSFFERFWINLSLYTASGRTETAPGRPTRLTTDELAPLWTDLASGRPHQAYTAVWTLAQSAESAVPFLLQRLQELPPPDRHLRVPTLIVDLDDDKFPVRQRAEEELEKLGPIAEAALRHLLKGKPALEVQQRVERLLDKLDKLPPQPDEQLRMRRALVVLEATPTPAVRQFLTKLAEGSTNYWATVQARAALERLKQRAPKP